MCLALLCRRLAEVIATQVFVREAIGFQRTHAYLAVDGGFSVAGVFG
jgi:hypothetical protein